MVKFRMLYAIILLRYPLSQPVRLTALPKGEPRGAAVSARQITIYKFDTLSHYRQVSWYSEGEMPVYFLKVEEK